MTRPARLAPAPDGQAEAARYVTPEELAGWLRCSLKTVYRLAEADPTVPVLRLGRLIRFPRERLEAWLRSREQGPGRSRRIPKPLSPGAKPPKNTGAGRALPAPCAIPCAIEAAPDGGGQG
jgi:excisionase family DNA binding protein